MNEKLLDNYDKMVVKEKVAVIHCAFGDTPHTVAFVHVDKDLLETQKCDKAFMLTNSIDNAWWKNDDVTPMFSYYFSTFTNLSIKYQSEIFSPVFLFFSKDISYPVYSSRYLIASDSNEKVFKPMLLFRFGFATYSVII